MSRPLFQIARDIAADWKSPSPQAKTYLKGMYYLLGMDDRIADLDAATTVRMFLLYSKEWSGRTADRIKAELQVMRSSRQPTTAALLASQSFEKTPIAITHCELCDASLGSPGKFVEAYTYWQTKARMCMHCALFVTPGVDLGDGAVYVAKPDGLWLHVHGQAVLAVGAARQADMGQSRSAAKKTYTPLIHHRMRIFGRRVMKKCVSIIHRLLRRSA